jgi:hypothetical protein
MLTGWCRCCFRWGFCWPRALLDKAKKYVALNPPGVLVEDGTETKHEPTTYENEAYEDLLNSLKQL